MAIGCSLRLARADLARKEQRRRLIERLNEKEKLIGPHGPTQGGQISEEELAAEIEKQRTLPGLYGRAGREDLARWLREVLEWHAQASVAYDRD